MSENNIRLIEKLDDTLELLLTIFEEAKVLCENSNDRDFKKVVNKFEIIKDRLLNHNLVELDAIK